WQSDIMKLDYVKLIMVENYNTTLNLYRAGEIDWIGINLALPIEFVPFLRKYDDFWSYPYLGVYWYWVNSDAEPTDDVRVRRALSLAIDRESIGKRLFTSGQVPMGGFIPDGLAGYEQPEFPLFDAERAKALLAEAGYPGGKGFPPLTLIYNTAEAHKQLAEALQAQWTDTLGIEVEILNQEWKVYQKKLQAMDFQVARMGWLGDYTDPYTFLEVFSGTSGNNHSNWQSSEYDRLLLELNSTQDRTRRARLMAEAESLLVENVPAIPLYVYARTDLVKPYVSGYWGNLQNRHPFKWMGIRSEWYDFDAYPNTPKESPDPYVKP
ncbi:MAG: peptide ABC transporter substrate-binding protein, partial [Myxococcota bacterium]